MFANLKQISLVVGASIGLVVLLVWWAGNSSQPDNLLLDDANSDFQAPLTVDEQERINPNNINDMNPVAVFDTSKGTFELELFTDLMPITAGNFIKLAEDGFYNGVKFHRVIDGFMIQGGDPNTKDKPENTWGTGGPGYTIADEHISDPKLSNVRGTISMANSGPNSGGSQFFINLVDNTNLDFDKEPLTSKHPVFGRVIDGMNVVDEIAKVATKERDIPVDPVIINSVTIKEQ